MWRQSSRFGSQSAVDLGFVVSHMEKGNDGYGWSVVGFILSIITLTWAEGEIPEIFNLTSWLILLSLVWSIGILSYFLFKVTRQKRELKKWTDSYFLGLKDSFASLFSSIVFQQEVEEKLSLIADHAQIAHEEVIELQRQSRAKSSRNESEQRHLVWKAQNATLSFRLVHDQFYHVYDLALMLNESLREAGLTKFEVELRPRDYKSYLTKETRRKA